MRYWVWGIRGGQIQLATEFIEGDEGSANRKLVCFAKSTYGSYDNDELVVLRADHDDWRWLRLKAHIAAELVEP